MARRKIVYDPSNDYYEILGVSPKASAETIQQTYRKKAKQYHPDLNQDRLEWATAQFQSLNEAYAVLGDATLRQQYDQARLGDMPPRTSRKTTRTQSGANWWDVPHAKSPNTGARPRPRTANPPPKNRRVGNIRRGEWLESAGVGFLRPLYLPFASLIFSPYRFVLGVLFVVLLANIIFILVAVPFMEREQERDEQATLDATTTVTAATNTPAEAAQGLIQPSAIPTRPLLPTPVVVDPCPYVLPIVGIESGNNRIKITVAPTMNIDFFVNARWLPVREQGTDLISVGEWDNEVDMLFSDTTDVGQVQYSTTLSGAYVLEWTAILGEQQSTCRQHVTIP